MSLVFTENASWHSKDLRERTRDLRIGLNMADIYMKNY